MNPINYQAFCYPDDLRHALQTPTTHGDYSYCTDGRIMIKIPALPEPEYRDKDKCTSLQTFEKVFSTAGANITFDARPISELIGDHPPEPCDTCKGAKVVEKAECDHCEGDGYLDCECCGQERECPTCKGDGFIEGTGHQMECSTCRGEGFKPQLLPIGISQITEKYARLIQTLPDAVVFLPKSESEPITFKFTDGHGAIMPVRKSQSGGAK